MTGGAAGAIYSNGFVITKQAFAVMAKGMEEGVHDASLMASAMPAEGAAFDFADNLVAPESGKVPRGEGAKPCLVVVGVGTEEHVLIIRYRKKLGGALLGLAAEKLDGMAGGIALEGNNAAVRIASAHYEVLIEDVGILLAEAFGKEAAGDGAFAAVGGEEDTEERLAEVDGPCHMLGAWPGGGMEDKGGEEVAEAWL